MQKSMAIWGYVLFVVTLGLAICPPATVAMVGGSCLVTVPALCTVSAWPECQVQCTNGNPGHPTKYTVLQDANNSALTSDDQGGWIYHANRSDVLYGNVQVNCQHPDIRNTQWVSQ